MNDVTRILAAIEQGDPKAPERLLPLVYNELRKLAAQRLAHEKPGQTLQATALVHEVFLRLTGGDAARSWDGRGHFFAAAAEAMRRILIENAAASSPRGTAAAGGGNGSTGSTSPPPRRPTRSTCLTSTRPSTGWPPSTPRPPGWSSSATSPA